MVSYFSFIFLTNFQYDSLAFCSSKIATVGVLGGRYGPITMLRELGGVAVSIPELLKAFENPQSNCNIKRDAAAREIAIEFPETPKLGELVKKYVTLTV